MSAVPRRLADQEGARQAALNVLGTQRFLNDPQAQPRGRRRSEGPLECGRFGGNLEGDWDSAIHALIELVRPRPAAPASTAGQQLEGLLEHIHELLAKPEATADTLRINYLALMALVRAALRPSAHSALFALAERSFDREFGRVEEVLPFASVAGAAHGHVEPHLFTRFVDALELELETRASEARRERTATNALLRAKLRALLLLAACPNATRARHPPAVIDELDALFALASANDFGSTESGDWPPLGFFADGAAVVTALHLVASRALGAAPFDGDGSTPLGELTFDLLLPSPESVRRLLQTLGTVPQAKDLSSGLGLFTTPRSRLDSDKAEAWERSLLETRGPGGLYCYLPFTTGVAVLALERYADVKHLPAGAKLRKNAKQSLDAVRADRFKAGKVVHGLPFAQFAIYNELVLRSLLLVWHAPYLRSGYTQWNRVLPAVNYLLACQATTGLFQERFGANEPDEGETAGSTLSTLASFSRTLDDEDFSKELGLDAQARSDLQHEIAYALELAVEGFLSVQNPSGGFATFARTEREKQGVLGVFEGPGAQSLTLYDAPAADSTSWVIDGLCALDSHAASMRPVPGVSLRPSVSKDVDAAIERAVGWLRRDFHPEAGWWARYGGGYVSGTSFALRALRSARVSPRDPLVARAAKLLKRNQDASGGWSQTTDADDPKHNEKPGEVAMRGGPVDPELTGLALLGLLDAGVQTDDAAVMQGISYLLHTQRSDGRHGWVPRGMPHSFMRLWNYQDQLHTDLRPTEALLRWSLGNPA